MSASKGEAEGIRRIGHLKLDLEQRALFRGAELVPLTPKALDTLAVLTAQAGSIVSKSELMSRVWPDTFVEENNLNQSISALRKALGADASIETIPRRGYRLVMAETPAEISPRSSKSRRRWSLAAAVLTACAAAVVMIRSGATRPAAIDSLVVLPFVNLSPNHADEYFSDGLTEEVTSDLAQIEGLRVVARTTAFQFKDKPQDVREICGRLGVAAALEGSVRRQGNQLRVTAQLNSAANGYHLWSQIYNGEAGNVFAIQQSISRAIADALKRRLPYAARLRPPPTRSLEAHNLYLQALHLRNTTDPPAVQKAVEYLQQASARDPGYAAPYAGLADCYVILAWAGAMPAVQALPLAKAAAGRALELDGTLAAAHTSLAVVHLVFDWDWPGAEREFRRAIELNPSDAEAFHWYSHYAVVANRLDDSLTYSRRALELDPLDLLVSAHLGWHYIQAHQYEDAVNACRKTLELDPHNNLAFTQIADAYEHLGRYEDAIGAVQRADGGEELASVLRKGWRSGGPQGYWRAHLEQRPHDQYDIARIYARLGEGSKALDALESAYAGRSPGLIYLKHEPYFDSLAGNRRFVQLIKSLRLP